MGILYNKENLLRVYYTTRRTYSGYTTQHGEPKHSILYNVKIGEPSQGILYNKDNLLRVYFTTRRTYSGYTL